MTRRGTLKALAGACLVASVPVARAAPSLRIGIIGAGHVGSTLGGLWVKAGYHVMFAAQSLDQPRDVAQSLGPLASAGTPAQAAAFGDVVFLAVPYRAIPSLGPQLSPILRGKTVLDATNPYGFRDGAIARIAATDGAGMTTQRYFPGAHVVRGFNSVDMSSIASEAHRTPDPLAIPIAGNDAAALKQAAELVTAAGFTPVVTGDLASARLFQPGNPGFELERDAAGLRAALHVSP
ncbi:oxidoreductase [Neoasaia chiangmaiensis NBRC 101099]|nr:oxidoreductase [Neoasaia chiangmaiensis NBRC 101099]